MDKETIQYRVKLAPEFAEICDNWDLETCRRMSVYFSQLAHQLKMLVKVADADREYRRPAKHPLRCVVNPKVRESN